MDASALQAKLLMKKKKLKRKARDVEAVGPVGEGRSAEDRKPEIDSVKIRKKMKKREVRCSSSCGLEWCSTHWALLKC